MQKTTLDELQGYPGMVHWFDPVLLSKQLGNVIVSGIFGQYADRRLIHAALDTVPPEELLRRADLTADLAKDKDGAVWIDYVADLGDGFDATYAIASLLAAPALNIDGHQTSGNGARTQPGMLTPAQLAPFSDGRATRWPRSPARPRQPSKPLRRWAATRSFQR